jgi:hypothetical protein
MHSFLSVIALCLRPLQTILLSAALALPFSMSAQESDWSMGAYAGRYHDLEPAGFIQGRANFLDQYLVALTANKTVWQSASWPLSLEIDAMVGQQSGVASLTEIAVAPALRWSGFPWNNLLHTSVAVAPLGISFTTSVSPLERGRDGLGSRALNWLFLEVAFSRPRDRSSEFFMRLHHRCTIYDLLNDFGANGEDFFAVGFRRRF